MFTFGDKSGNQAIISLNVGSNGLNERDLLRRRLHCTVFVRKRRGNALFWPTVYTNPFPIRRQKKTIAKENTIAFTLCHFHMKTFPYRFRMKTVQHKRGLNPFLQEYLIFCRVSIRYILLALSSRSFLSYSPVPKV